MRFASWIMPAMVLVLFLPGIRVDARNPAPSPVETSAVSTTRAAESVITRAPPSSWDARNVPDHAAWAKDVLLMVVWIFVLAVLAGPLIKYATTRKPGSPGSKDGMW